MKFNSCWAYQKTAFFVLGIFLGILPPTYSKEKKSTSTSSTLKLGIGECYQRALARSEALALSKEAIRQTEIAYSQALSAVLPEISLVFRERIRNLSSGGSSFDDGGSGFSSSGGGRYRFDTQLQVSQSIFRGFRDYHVLGALEANQRASQSDYKRDQQTLFLDTSDLYYQILTQRRDLEILYELDRALLDRTNELSERVELGRSRESELLAARTEYADNKAVIQQVRGLLSASKELMAFLLGRPASSFILIDDKNGQQAGELAEYLVKIGVRPDIQAQEERVFASQKEVSASRAAFWPSIDFRFNWLALEDPERSEEWNMFFTAELPIFDGGLRAADLSESKSQSRSSQLSLSQLRRLAEYDIRLAYSNFTATARQMIQLREAVQVAKESLAAQKNDYQLGRASNLDVLNALIRYEEVNRRFAVTGYLMKSNLNALHIAAGEIPFQPQQN
ncbi:MAG: TolC family protein [Verrucomicrobiota bacterium]